MQLNSLCAAQIIDDAQLQVTDDGRPYGMHSGVCRISMDGKWDADGEPMEEYAEFDL